MEVTAFGVKSRRPFFARGSPIIDQLFMRSAFLWPRSFWRGYVEGVKDTEIQANFDRLQALIEHLAAVVRAGFERTDLRFERVDHRLERMESRLDGVDARFDHVDARFDRVDARFNQVDARFIQVDARFDHLRDMMAEHFEVLETRLNERLDRLEQRV
jgi:hypothetical protein